MNMQSLNADGVMEVDVLLVGLGPVGATVANLLGRYGVNVLGIDQATEIFMAPRAIVLDNEALRILQMAGVQEQDFDKIAIPQVQMYSPLFGRFARMNTARQIDGHPMLVTFFQPELEAVLRQKLGQYAHVKVSLGTTLESFEDKGSFVIAQVRDGSGRSIRIAAKYLVATDGANSTVRKALQLDFKGETFGQDWLVVDAKQVPNPIDHIEFLCDPKRPAPHMVAPGGRQRWEFMLQPGESREEMEKPETVKRLLAPWANADEIEIERTAVYRFHARVADRFSVGRCFLGGDAAHITPPFAGQGLVAGLRDAANLSWKLAWVLHGQASPAILESYNQERQPHAREIIGLALLMGKLVMPANRFKAFLIHGFMSLIRLVPAGRALFEDLKVKPQNTFKAGLFLRTRSTKKLLAGSTFPQGLVRRADNGEIVLSDDMLGQTLTFVSFGSDPCTALNPQLQLEWTRYGGTCLQWCMRGQGLHLGPAERRVEALDDLLTCRSIPMGWTAIVRPDRTVLCEGPFEQAAELVHETVRLLGMTTRPTQPDPFATLSTIG
nr:bifunctional 3-(3-hydroxy-phenyl)propionate/3-hydroxycinnamic acid hydroxylase [Rhodoferax ferrireducens]